MIFQLILSLYLFGSAYGRTEEEIKSWFSTLAMECSKDHPIPLEELTMMQKNQMPTSENAKCLMACVFRRAKWLDDKGSFDINSANAFADKEYSDNATMKENAKKLFDHCKKANEETVNDGEKGCERSYHLSKCLMENSPKMGFTA